MKNNKQTIIVFNIIAAVFVLGMLAIIFSSCNPVKQVLRDEYKMRKVWNEGALDGWCVNDTLIVNKSDTLITFDTLFAIDYNTDTFTVDKEIVKVKTVLKTIRITDTFTNIVTDNSRIDLLQKEIGKLLLSESKLKEDLDFMTQAVKTFKQDRNHWKLRFFLLAASILLYLLRKPILFLITKIKL